ncbi:helix-turn-helix domain-containing protein [Nocardia sp. NPDC059239]|uniref:helix-turn-helix domain-containing protein n=1 Tax=unclassified Nocardia TaxID=2637762 RepID=UPI00368F09E1
MDRGSLSRAFGHELRVRRRGAGLTAEQMWNLLQWRRGTYRRTESGLREPTLGDICEIAEAFNVSPSTIVVAAKKRWEAGDYPERNPGDEWQDILGT